MKYNPSQRASLVNQNEIPIAISIINDFLKKFD